MKLVVPLAIALLGLGAGVGAGLALKPEPPKEEAGHAGCPAPDAAAAGEHGDDHAAPAAAPCPEAEAAEKPAPKPEGELAYVAIEKPFIAPIFRDDKIVAMVMMSLSVEVGKEGETTVKDAEPRLRDAFLKVMFRHANSGGFDGSFTVGQKIEDLKSGLLQAARTVLPEAPISEVLITELARQDS
ncbi:MAG: flagellar basal body-associated FliL family protein [Amaricoccus sp.]